MHFELVWAAYGLSRYRENSQARFRVRSTSRENKISKNVRASSNPYGLPSLPHSPLIRREGSLALLALRTGLPAL